MFLFATHASMSASLRAMSPHGKVDGDLADIDSMSASCTCELSDSSGGAQRFGWPTSPVQALPPTLSASMVATDDRSTRGGRRCPGRPGQLRPRPHRTSRRRHRRSRPAPPAPVRTRHRFGPLLPTEGTHEHPPPLSLAHHPRTLCTGPEPQVRCQQEPGSGTGATEWAERDRAQ